MTLIVKGTKGAASSVVDQPLFKCLLAAKKRLLYLGTIPPEAFRLTNHDALAVVT